MEAIYDANIIVIIISFPHRVKFYFTIQLFKDYKSDTLNLKY